MFRSAYVIIGNEPGMRWVMVFDPEMKLTRENFGSLPPLCTDGAWGTELQKLGAPPGLICDTWNLEQPDKVLTVARSYVDAGSQVILTNTFSGNRIMLAKHNAAEQAVAICKAGAEISKRAAAGKAYVFASLGPCGKMVMMAEIDTEEVEQAYAEQALALVTGGADALVIETQSDLVEAEAALRGCLRVCKVPVGVTFTFDSGPQKDRTMMGVSVNQAYDLATAGGASFVGANCGAGIETFVGIARQFRACGTDLPIWVKGNAGQPELDESGNCIYKAPPQVYADLVRPLLDAGAHFIGGCCGSTPAHIRAIAEQMPTAG
ncbi:MAG: homocysteine S-methyltransferase family protein [Phycisphaerales bacterium]|nr:MAG: homocysteine S-methyltransferase family protein [Phycisphaerales bacterium]